MTLPVLRNHILGSAGDYSVRDLERKFEQLPKRVFKSQFPFEKVTFGLFPAEQMERLAVFSHFSNAKTFENNMIKRI